jgi:uncharacterized membrane protein
MAKGRPVNQPGRPVFEGVVRRERIVITKSILAGDELAKIEAAVPGGADRVITLVEAQSVHRQRLEDKVVSSNITGERFGQISALAVALGAMYFGYGLLMADKPLTGFVFALGPIAALAGIFLVGKRRRDRDLDSKDMHT